MRVYMYIRVCVLFHLYGGIDVDADIRSWQHAAHDRLEIDSRHLQAWLSTLAHSPG